MLPKRRRNTRKGPTETGTAPRFPGGIPEGAPEPDREFYALADRFLDDLFRTHPTWSTIVGHHLYDTLLEDMTPEGLEERLGLARRHRTALAAVDPAGLSASARVDRDLVLNEIEWTIFALAELRPFAWDPQSYVDLLGHAVLFLTVQDPASNTWPERLEALLSRMGRIPALLAAARRNLAAPPRVITDLAIRTNPGNIAFFERTIPPLFARAPALRRHLEREAAQAVAALKGFQAWLEADLRPRSTGDWRLGRDLWSRKLRFTLQSAMTPEEIARRAEEWLEAGRRRLLEASVPLHDRLFPAHRHRETGDALIDAIGREVLECVCSRQATRHTLLEEARRAAERARDFIRRARLVDLPPEDDAFVIEPTPGFMDGVAVAFFNAPPVLEPHLRKSFWISSVPRGASPEEDRALEASYLREYNHYAIQGLTIHEAFPGHYVQYWHALRSPYATVYKKILASGTFAEGWAVLAEKQMFDAGYAGDETENLLAHIKQGLRAPINALLDARLHTEALPEEEGDRWALDLMRRKGFQEEAEARAKLRRAKVSSTQLSTYFVGFVELCDILADARRRAGPAFDLHDFNMRLLSLGTIPPRHARELLGLPSQ
jgi:uncharacterized protein (DUF885 family)